MLARSTALALLIAGLTALPTITAAQTPTPPPAQPPRLEYRVQAGGLLAGVFAAIDIPAIGINLAGNDVNMIALSGPKDGRKVVLTSGTIKEFTFKKLQPMVGQQMSIKITVAPLGAAPGRRCRVILDEARLEKITLDSMTLQPSETPQFVCE